MCVFWFVCVYRGSVKCAFLCMCFDVKREGRILHDSICEFVCVSRQSNTDQPTYLRLSFCWLMHLHVYMMQICETDNGETVNGSRGLPI